MSKIDYQALRAKAEKATCGEWSLEYGESRFDGDDALIHREVAGYIPICRIEGAHPESGFDEDFQMEQQANAEFIAAANPATVLALLDERERNQQYIKRRDQENEEIALTVGKLLIENGRLVADTLRHLADNEIDSDYFAITSTNENGTEIDHEMSITDYALQAAGTVDELVAALEAEPIGFRCRRNDNLGDWSYVYHREPDDFERKHLVIEGIYAAPPAPVVPEEMYWQDAPVEGSIKAAAYATGWNACRAAMLQGGQPVNQTYSLPELIEGMEVSIDVSTCDADLGNRYFGTVTEALELDTAKNGYILLVQDAEPNFDVNGNSPVTPDGWISCSDRMPNDKQYVWCWGKSYGWTECDTFEGYYDCSRNKWWAVTDNGEEPASKVTHWMPLPESPQEAK